MIDESLLAIALPKYPFFGILGQDLNREQAAEVCLRTAICPSSHEGEEGAIEWFQALSELTGTPLDRYYHLDHTAWYASMATVGSLLSHGPHLSYDGTDTDYRLDYLSTDALEPIWCGTVEYEATWVRWTGEICWASVISVKNPTMPELMQECRLLAWSFPFLEMRAQVWGGDTEATLPAAEFVLHRGGVELVRPTRAIAWPRDESPEQYEARMDRIRARIPARLPVPVEHLRWAFAMVKDKMIRRAA